jgi:hypothetical protein
VRGLCHVCWYIRKPSRLQMKSTYIICLFYAPAFESLDELRRLAASRINPAARC